MISQKLKFQTSFFFKTHRNSSFRQLLFRQSDLHLTFGNPSFSCCGYMGWKSVQIAGFVQIFSKNLENVLKVCGQTAVCTDLVPKNASVATALWFSVCRKPCRFEKLRKLCMSFSCRFWTQNMSAEKTLYRHTDFRGAMRTFSSRASKWVPT